MMRLAAPSPAKLRGIEFGIPQWLSVPQAHLQPALPEKLQTAYPQRNAAAAKSTESAG